MRNPKVIQRWLRGKKGRSGTGALRTDGNTLYSYQVVIGESREREKVVFDYRGPNRIGLATTRHICCAIREGGGQICVESPPSETDIDAIRKLVVPKDSETASEEAASLDSTD